MSRMIIASNRLPVTAKVEKNNIELELSSGGLATGLRRPHERSGGIWIGWPGDLPRMDQAGRKELNARLAAERLVPIYLTRAEVREYYEDISNGMLWPVFQYLVENLPLTPGGWDTFRSVNERFAQTIAAHYQPGDYVWIHDYQLLLVPGMLRDLIPDARIGFFLHITFPSDDVFSVLPWREEILRGMLGADLVGFHTAGYVRNFAASLRRVLGLDPEVEVVRYADRDVRIGAFPMGIDTAGWEALASEPDIIGEVATIKGDAAGRKILLGIDRLDYTKGIPRRLVAIKQLLDEDPDARDNIRVVQVTVPSRERVEAYAAFRRRIDELVSEINGAYTTASAVPIHRLHQSLSQSEVSALYQAADVMLVTSLRDGMNLVAKEFVASRVDDDGVLIISEFAGAAAELGDALVINPYDIDQLTNAIRQAMSMPREERRARMQAMRQRVKEYDVHRWVEDFIATLKDATSGEPEQPQHSSPRQIQRLTSVMKSAHNLLLILDYDGTLVPFYDEPDEAAPDEELLKLLEQLARRPNTTLHIVSGRTRDSIDRWLSHLPIGLHAEHGLFSRPPHARSWRETHSISPEWKDKVRPVMEHFTSTTRGSFIEEKSVSLVWHYRTVKSEDETNGDYGEGRARELRTVLGELLTNTPLEVLPGKKVVEVRPLFVNKGALAPIIVAEAPDDAVIFAMGDDRTDEDLFAALPPDALTVHVGEGASRARYGLDDFSEARRILWTLLD